MPGVTDNVGRTAREALEACLAVKLQAAEKVYASRQYLIRGKLSKEEAERIATQLLGNPLINRFEIKSRQDWDPKKGMGILRP